MKVQIDLASGIPLDRQRLFEEQSLAKLKDLGFKEKVGYDNRGHTRLLGTVPVEELETLLADLRAQPEGWLAPVTPTGELPQPLRGISPLRVIEVLPEPEGVAAAKEPPAETPPAAEGREFLLKITPDLRDLAMQEGQAEPRRLDVILDRTDSTRTIMGADPPTQTLASLLKAGPGRCSVLATPKSGFGSQNCRSFLQYAWRVRYRPRAIARERQRPREALRAAGLIDCTTGHRGRHRCSHRSIRGYRSPRQAVAGTRYVDPTADQP